MQAAEIALFRLRYPRGLSAEAENMYEAFLRDHLCEVLMGYLGDGESFKWLFRRFVEGAAPAGAAEPAPLTEAELEALSAAAAKGRLAEISGLLADFRHRAFPKKTSKFEF